MRDHVRHLVASLDIDLARERVATLPGWLADAGIIMAQASACGADGPAFAPGPQVATALDCSERDIERLRRLPLNGLSLQSGRMFYHSAPPALAHCPHCGHPLDLRSDPRWIDALEHWMLEAGDGGLECSACLQKSPLPSWLHTPPVAFGTFGLSAWNWPPFRAAFVEHLQDLIGAPLQAIDPEAP